MLETANPSSAQPTPLSWLTNWVAQPMEMAPGFDLEEIKPQPTPITVTAGNLLEVTVWDLYEPGKPYSFPVRVSEGLRVEAPLLGEISVENRTISQVESRLVDGYRKGDLLLNPRVLVRALDAPVIKVHVSGAVVRPGYVELTRADRSAYAAILSAGGLHKTAGTQVAITRAAVMPVIDGSVDLQPTMEPEPKPVDPVDNELESSAPNGEWDEPRIPTQRANSLEELSVSPAPPVVRPAAANRGLYSVDEPYAEPESHENLTERHPPGRSPQEDSRARPQVTQNLDVMTRWYDVSLARDRDELKSIVLGEGDIVTVKAAALPLRVTGFVNRPGAYPLPPGRSLNAWQAIDLAGGVRDDSVPLVITLSRPASEGRPPRRWPLSIASYQLHPTPSPLIEPGDELRVEPTTGTKIKRVVHNVWSKP